MIKNEYYTDNDSLLIIGTPYWSQGAKKQFYVSKRCATKKGCERLKRNNMPDCTHIWYQDWKCSSCCQGDRCNYYVIVSIKFIFLVIINLRKYNMQKPLYHSFQSSGDEIKLHKGILVITILISLLSLKFQ